MKIVKGIQMSVFATDTEDFEAQLAGQLAIKDATGFHSATFDEKEKKATFVYLNFDDPGRERSGRLVTLAGTTGRSSRACLRSAYWPSWPPWSGLSSPAHRRKKARPMASPPFSPWRWR